MKKIFITGIDGFVGGHLINQFISQKYELFGTGFQFYDDMITNINNNKVNIKKIDILNKSALTKFINEVKPDGIIHLAAQSQIPLSWSNTDLTFDVNIKGTNNLLRSVIDCQLEKIPILIVGAAAQYGHVKSNGQKITENDSFAPDNPYAVSKCSADLIAYQYSISHNLKIVRVRPFTHIGPGQKENFVCSEFAKKIVMIEYGLRKNVIKVGNIDIIRDFLDVRDVVKAYQIIIENSLAGEVYNVCSGIGTSIKKILEILNNQSNKKLKIIVDKTKFRKNEALAIIGNNEKLKKELLWEPAYTLENTLKDILDYWRNKIK